MIRIYKSGKQSEKWRKCAQEAFDCLPDTEAGKAVKEEYKQLLYWMKQPGKLYNCISEVGEMFTNKRNVFKGRLFNLYVG